MNGVGVQDLMRQGTPQTQNPYGYPPQQDPNQFYDHKPIRPSRLRQQELFEQQFQKPMAERNPAFKKQPASGTAGTRMRSVGLAHMGSQVLQQVPNSEDMRFGKRMITHSSNSTHNLLTGGYGADPASNLELGFKPYAQR
jgi:hypothetical protein